MNKQILPVNDIATKALDTLFARFQDLDTNALLIYLIDSVDESALPHLAEQFCVIGNEGWLQARTETEKRQLIKQSIGIHKIKGTKYALKRIFEMYGIEGNIQEWWEYGGEPYTFRVNLDFVSKPLDFQLIEKLEALIDEYKNVRTHLESLNISISTFGVMPKIKTGIITGENITIEPPAKPLIWDVFNWDGKNWSRPYIEKIDLPVLLFNDKNFDETIWAFG